MPQPNDTPLTPDGPLPAHASHRDVQRAALRELVGLLTESATTESEIEARHRAALAELGEAVTKTRQDIEHRYASRREETEQTYQQRTADIERRFREGFDALDGSSEDARQRINREHDTVVAGVKRRFEQSTFMADSLLEATQNAIRDEARKAKQAYEEQMTALDGMEVQAAELVQEYGQTLNELPPEAAKIQGDAEQAFKSYREATERHLSNLRTMSIPRLFVGLRPWVALVVLLAVGGIAGQLIAGVATGRPDFNSKYVLIGVGASLALGVLLGLVLRVVGLRQVRREHDEFRRALAATREAADLRLANLRKAHDARNAGAQRTRDIEVRGAKEKFAPYLQRADETRDENLQNVQAEYLQKVSALESQRDRGRKEADHWRRQTLHDLARQQEEELNKAEHRSGSQSRESQRWYADARAAVERRWHERVEQIRTPIERGAGGADGEPAGWDEAYWRNWAPPKRFGSAVRFGELRVDLKRIADEHPQGASFKLELPPPFAVAATLGVPRQA